MDANMDNKLREIFLKLANESVAKKSFEEAVKALLKFILEIEKRLIGKIDILLSSAVSELKQTEKSCKEAVGGTIKELITKVDQKLGMVRDGKDGKDGKDGENGIDGKNGKDGSPDTADQIIKKIEGLLEIRDIKELKEKLEELEKKIGRRPFFGGGGFSVGALNMHLIDWTVLATGDGTTTQFTLPYTPSPASSLQVKVGGGELFAGITEDWTLSGLVVMFLVAPPNGAKIRYKCRI
jgi:hypothetical protein